mgnify:CR=1 FL=1
MLTLGKTAMKYRAVAAMGRKTFESIGKPLPGRTSVVITRQQDLQFEGCIMANSLQDALQKCQGQEEVFIIGGAQIFKTETGSGLFTIGERNIESIKKILCSHGIQVLAEETGKTYGRWVKFDLQSGSVDVKSKRGNATL